MAKLKRVGNMLVEDVINSIIPQDYGKILTINDMFGDMYFNPTDEFVSEVDENEKRKKLKPSAWTCKFRRIRGQKFSFKSRPYQHQIINDLHPKQVIRKAAQLGISEIMLTKLFWFCDYSIGGPSAKIIYTFPTYSDMLTYAAARIPPIIEDALIMNENMYGWQPHFMEEPPTYIDSMMVVNSAKLRRIRDTFLFLKGTMGDNSAISVDSDWNIHDEINFSNQSVLNKFHSRLGASKLGWEYNFSTPTIPAYGVSKMFNSSDQNFWYITCPHCGKSYKMDFKINVVELAYERKKKEGRSFIYQCQYCKREISDNTRANGRYIAEVPSIKDYRGYHIDKMINPVISADELIKSKNSYRKEADFWNFDLGLEYSEKTTNLTLELLEQLKTVCGVYSMWSFAKVEDMVTMGVDQGDTLWVEISANDVATGKRKVIYAEKVDYKEFEDEDPFQRLPELMERYNVHVCVIDALPNKNDSRAFKNQFLKDHRVFMAYYTATKDGDINVNKDEGVVNIDRTEGFKWTFNRIYNGEIGIPSDCEIMELWEQHMCNLKKETIEDDATGKITESFERTGPDHFNHAHLYDEVAYDILMNVLGGNKPKRDGFASTNNVHWAVRKGFVKRNGMLSNTGLSNSLTNRVGGISTIPSSIRKGR